MCDVTVHLRNDHPFLAKQPEASGESYGTTGCNTLFKNALFPQMILCPDCCRFETVSVGSTLTAVRM